MHTKVLAWYLAFLPAALVAEPAQSVHTGSPSLSFLDFEGSRPIALPSLKDPVLETHAFVNVPWGAHPRSLWRLSGFLASEAKSLLALSKTQQPLYGPDSVDGQPSYETHLFHSQEVLPAAVQLVQAIRSKVQEYARQRYSCPECFVCSGILRQYGMAPNARRQHPLHYDVQAYATAIVGLNPSEYSGGIYVQESEHVTQRQFLPLESGDAAFHQYDLRHGVEVFSGARHSAVFWITDTAESCEHDVTPWFLSEARNGQPDAQAIAGRMYMLGRGGVAQDSRIARDLYEKASRQGHPGAKYKLAQLLLQGNTLDKDMGAKWCEESAIGGHAPAQVLLGSLLESRDLKAAVAWYKRAADQSHPAGMYNFGRHVLLGSTVDQASGTSWIRRSKELGFGLAKDLWGQLPTELRRLEL